MNVLGAAGTWGMFVTQHHPAYLIQVLSVVFVMTHILTFYILFYSSFHLCLKRWLRSYGFHDSPRI